jgi:hypothetical protein
MSYMMVFAGFDYTRESWYAIPALWGYVLLTLVLAAMHRFAGGIAMLFGSYLVSTYFADVYGYVPGTIIAMIAVALVAHDIRAGVGRPGMVPGSDLA